MKPCYVYWIHRKDHNDITSQGYVGVTTNIQERKYNHVRDLITESHINPHLQHAYQINALDFLFDVVLVGSTEYCYYMEEILRPRRAIGWNINSGGTCPPSQKGKLSSISVKIEIQGVVYGSKSQAAKSLNTTPYYIDKLLTCNHDSVESMKYNIKLGFIEGVVQRNGHKVVIDDVIFNSCHEAGLHLGVSAQTVINRIKSNNTKWEKWKYYEYRISSNNVGSRQYD